MWLIWVPCLIVVAVVSSSIYMYSQHGALWRTIHGRRYGTLPSYYTVGRVPLAIDSEEDLVPMEKSIPQKDQRLTEMLPYLSDSEVEGYLAADKGLKRKQGLLWNLEKWDRQDTALGRIERTTLTEAQRQAKNSLTDFIEAENSDDFKEDLALYTRYKRFVELVPSLDDESIDEFTSAIQDFAGHRQELIQRKTNAAVKREAQLNELKQKLFDVMERYPFQFQQWSKGQQYLSMFEDEEEFSVQDIIELHKMFSIEYWCFIIEGHGSHVSRVRLVFNKGGFRIHPRGASPHFKFYLDDGSTSLTTTVDGYDFEIVPSKYDSRLGVFVRCLTEKGEG